MGAVGLSRQRTAEENTSPLRGHGVLEHVTYGSRIHGQMHNTPFTEDELTLALTKSTLEG